jgi:hypothetical protein
MNTKTKMFLLLLFSSVAVICYGIKKEKRLMMNEPSKGIAIVELFTSEGCSSCPPADRLLSKVATEFKDVYVLSYHVDYWNYLGWKDPFSQAAFTDRQRKYAKRFNLETIYTPQVVINGTQEFVGSDEQRLLASLLKNNSLDAIELKGNRKDASTISLSYNIKTTDPLWLQIAFVQPLAVSTVKRGENSGRTLSHINVVRQLITVDVESPTGLAELKIPSSLQIEAFDLILFTQQKNDDKVRSAARINFSATSVNK